MSSEDTRLLEKYLLIQVPEGSRAVTYCGPPERRTHGFLDQRDRNSLEKAGDLPWTYIECLIDAADDVAIRYFERRERMVAGDIAHGEAQKFLGAIDRVLVKSVECGSFARNVIMRELFPDHKGLGVISDEAIKDLRERVRSLRGLRKQGRPLANDIDIVVAAEAMLQDWQKITGRPINRGTNNGSALIFYGELLPRLRVNGRTTIYPREGGLRETWEDIEPFATACVGAIRRKVNRASRSLAKKVGKTS